VSESYWLLIDSHATLDEAPALAATVIQLLLERQILAPVPAVPEIRSRWRGEAGAAAESACVVDQGDDPGFHDFEVWVGRQVYSSSLGDFAPERAICRHCASEVDDADAIKSACSAWHDGNDRAALACPDCGQSSPLRTWDFDKAGGIGNLAFLFWSWPDLRPGFIRDLERVLGHPLVLALGRC
jgi:hypothetical protein